MTLNTQKTAHSFDFSCATEKDLTALKSDSFMKTLIANGIILSPKKEGGLKLHTKAEVAPDLLKSISEQKESLLAYLTQQPELENPIGPYPLSEQQDRLWLAYQADTTSSAYNEPLVLSFSQDIDLATMLRSIESLQIKYPILRVCFSSIEGIPFQWVSSPYTRHEYFVHHQDKLSVTAYEEELKKIALTPFDLTCGPLYRVGLYQLKNGISKLVIVLPHILIDGWSIMNLVNELAGLYKAYSAAEVALSPAAPDTTETHTPHYSDIVFTKSNDMNHTAAERLNFWSHHFESSSQEESGFVEPGILPALYSPSQSDENIFKIVIPASSVGHLAEISRRLRVSEASVYLALYAVAFSKTAMLSEFIVSTPFANRNEYSAQDYMGLLVNTLPIRVSVDSQQTLSEHIQTIHGKLLEYIELQDTPLELILKQSSLKQKLSCENLFQSVFEFQTFESQVLFGDLVAEIDDNPFQNNKFPLTFLLRKGDDLELEIEFNTDIYHRRQIEGFASAFLNVLFSLVTDTETSIASISLLGNQPEHYLNTTFNYAQLDWNERYDMAFQNANVLFYQRVLEKPDQIAVKTTRFELTYQQVFHHAVLLANQITDIETSPEAVIGVFMSTSCELLVSMLGTFISGRTYLPLDPALPDQRLQAIIKKSNCRLLICHGALKERVQNITRDLVDSVPQKSANFTIMPFDEQIELSANLVNQPIPKLPISADVKRNQLAYVIFTSGSSGEPKGAMIEHEGMLNHLLAKAHDLNITADSVVGFLATPSFDVSIWQMLTALTVGGTTAIFEGEAVWEPAQLFHQVNEQQVNVVETVPSHLNALLEYCQTEKTTVPDNFLLMLNGEPLLREQCLRWQGAFPGSQLVNAYGLTEVSDDTCHFHISSVEVAQKYQCMPISGTLPNMKLYILDHDLCPVPAGVKGELYIGGIAVGRGYLADPRRTAERFIPDPFSAAPGARLYRSGDVVWADHEGVIHFLGRNDFQIKVRGFRIEVQEIENAIHQIIGIDNVAVMVNGAGDQKQILAFYLSSHQAHEVSPESVREHLLATLPHYMVPDTIVCQQEFPLTTNGKIDRKRLLAVHLSEVQQPDTAINNQYESETHTRLASIFSSTLNIASIGKQQSFFSIGINSLIALRIVNQIRSVFRVQIKVSDILKNETISKLADLIDNSSDNHAQNKSSDVVAALNAIQKLESPAVTKLTPYQLPEWYMYCVEPENPYYNISFPNIFFDGGLKPQVFLEALHYVISRHRVLHSRFATVNGEPTVSYDDNINIRFEDCLIEHTGLTPIETEEKIVEYADIYNHFTLDLGHRCFETKLIKYRDDYYQFIWVVHHIIWDETSTLIFFDELASVYNDLVDHRDPVLPPLPLEYSDFERTINGLLNTPAMQIQKAFWDQHLQGAPTLVNLPTDRPRQPSQTFNGDGLLFRFSPEEKQRIENYLSENHTTLFIYLLSILNLELFKITGEADQVIGAPIANRDSEGLQAIIGLFATALPLRSQLDPHQSFSSFLSQSKTVATDGFDNHNYPSIYALRDAAKGSSGTNVNRFNIMYGVQNDKTQWKEKINFEGVQYIEREEISIAEGNTARFDLTVVVDYVDEAIEVYFNFNTDLFDRKRMSFYLAGFRKLVLDTLEDDSKKLHQYSIISEAHPDWRTSFTTGKKIEAVSAAGTLHELVLEACEKYPTHIAIHDQGETYTYAQLKQAIAQYLTALSKYSFQPEEPVVIYSAHSFNALCAMIAVMYKGGTYVPLFSSTPAERALEVIAQSEAKVVFVSETLCHCETIQQHASTAKVYLLEHLELAMHPEQSASLLPFPEESSVISGQLAYSVFTSGTSGTPKGIAVPHSAIINTITSTVKQHNFTQTDNFLLMTESHFDPYFLDVFCALSKGAQITIVPECERKTPSHIARNLVSHEISFFQSTPTFLDSLCREMSFQEIHADNVRVIITGGEQVTQATVSSIRQVFPNASLANHYGPSEVAVDAVSTVLPTKKLSAVPIGSPIANAVALVLDHTLEPVPVNHVGELYILSPGLARGYVNHPAMTAERFIPSPFARFPGERMYRTGDIVKMDETDQIHFIGREDEQVKINGSRVELTEIEAVISAQKGVNVAAVIYQNFERTGYLAAYLKMTNVRHKVRGKTKQYTLYPLSHKPHLLAEITHLHAESWPEIFAADTATGKYWSELMRLQPKEQLILLNEQQHVAGAIHSTRIHWDGSLEPLAGGWSSAIQQGVEHYHSQNTNTLVALAALVSPEERGQKLSTVLLDKIKEHAIAEGMTRCIIPLRVTGKSRYPEMSFEEYALAKTPEGKSLDPWLSIHLAAGARIICIACQSQRVVASTRQWETWLGIPLSSEGVYTHPSLHTHLTVHSEGEGVYEEPCIWVEHPLSNEGGLPEQFVKTEQIRESVSSILPSYMLPSVWHTFAELPTNVNGKIDKIALQSLNATNSLSDIQPPQDEIACRVHEIWSRVLDQREFGVRCNFFMVGGHSINALQCIEAINSQFSTNISLKAFLLNPTIESICQALKQTEIAKENHLVLENAE